MIVYYCEKCGRPRFAPADTPSDKPQLNCAGCKQIQTHNAEELNITQDTGTAFEHWRRDF